MRASSVVGELPSTLTMRSPHSRGTPGSAGNTRKSGATKNPGYGRPTRAASEPNRTARAAAVRPTTRSAREFHLTIGHQIIRAAPRGAGVMTRLLSRVLTWEPDGFLMAPRWILHRATNRRR